MITFRHRGDLSKTSSFLKKARDKNFRPIIEKYAGQGIAALRSATPVDSGQTADSWGYELQVRPNGFSIFWTNSNIVEGLPVVILLQYGHGTRSGSFVEGRDFINPAIRPVFDAISENLWKEVSEL